MEVAVVLTFCVIILAYTNVCCGSAMRELCLIWSIPGELDGFDLNLFETQFNEQLESAMEDYFPSSVEKADYIQTANESCQNSGTSECCQFVRLDQIRDYLKMDLLELQNHLTSTPSESPMIYTILLSAWYLDKVFVDLNCGPLKEIYVLVPHPYYNYRIVVLKYYPVLLWEYFADFSHKISSQDEFCLWVLPLSKNVAINLRNQVKIICDNSDIFCPLPKMFSFIDSLSHLCELNSPANWNSGTAEYGLYQDAIKLAFFAMRESAPDDMQNNFHISTTPEPLMQSMLNILVEFKNEFKNGDLSLGRNLLKIIPNTYDFPCDQTAQFPSFKWQNCAFARTISQIRSYVINYETIMPGNLVVKNVPSNIDYKEYIRNIRDTQIQTLVEQVQTDLDAAVVTIQNTIQQRFRELGQYYRNISIYESRKKTEDVNFLNGRLQLYRDELATASTRLASKITTLLKINTAVTVADLAYKTALLMTRMAMAGNPLKWLTGSGNADAIMESAAQVADAVLDLANAIRMFSGFSVLEEKSDEISQKLDRNKDMIINIGNILNSASEGNFDEYKDQFMDQYGAYDPQVRRDEIEVLGSYWESFIDDLCSSIRSSESMVASGIKGAAALAAGPIDSCVETKAIATGMVGILLEIYDFQFELVEAMASLMLTLNQIESSNVLGQGLQAQYANNLTLDSLKSLALISSISYSITKSISISIYCNILEYKRGGNRHPDCQGVASDIDVLLSIIDPTCYGTLAFKTIPSTGNSNHAWLDLSMLYSNKSVRFQIPDSQWLVDNNWIFNSQRHYAFFLQGFEVFLPVGNERTRRVQVRVQPTDQASKLMVNSDTTYSLSPTLHTLKKSFELGPNINCRQNYFPNPYRICHSGPNSTTINRICPTSTESSTPPDNGRLAPSIYALYEVNVEGYSNDHLDVPRTSIPIQIGVEFCHIDPNNVDRKRRESDRLPIQKRENSNEHCCLQATQYYESAEGICKQCPSGSKSFYDGLFCGDVVKVLLAEDATQPFTYQMAVETCQNVGSEIATDALLTEAQNLGSDECTCGWISGEDIRSVKPRSQCQDTEPCIQNGNKVAIHVYCTTSYI